MIKKLFVGIIIISILGFIGYRKYLYLHTFEIIKGNKGTIEKYVNGIGNIGAKNIYKIGTIYGGRISKFTLSNGDYIKVGDLIGKVDSIDLKDKITEIKISINKLNLDIKGLNIDKEIAEKEFIYQKKLFEKNTKLYNKKAISKLSYDKYKLDYELSLLKIISLKTKIKSYNQQNLELISNLKGLNEKLIRYTIYSSINGYVSKKLITNYQTLSPNQSLVEIINPEDVWVKTYIDTRISGNVKIGDIALIKLRSMKKFVKGKVIKINPINNSITNEREIEVKFNNLPIPFYLNEQATIKIKTKTFNNLIKISNKVITMYKGKRGIWLYKNGKSKFKNINIVVNNGNYSGTYDLTNQDLIIVPNKNIKNNMSIIRNDFLTND